MLITGSNTGKLETPDDKVGSNYTSTVENMASQTFKPHEKKRLASFKVFAVIAVGNTGAGKTSLFRCGGFKITMSKYI